MTCRWLMAFFGYSSFLHLKNWRFSWNIVESGVKHTSPNPIVSFLQSLLIYWEGKTWFHKKKCIRIWYKFLYKMLQCSATASREKTNVVRCFFYLFHLLLYCKKNLKLYLENIHHLKIENGLFQRLSWLH